MVLAVPKTNQIISGHRSLNMPFKWSFIWFFFLVAFQRTISLDNKFEGEDCVLKDENKGVCINLHDCPSALVALKEDTNPSLCGFKGKDPLVCCKKNLTSIPLEDKIDTSLENVSSNSTPAGVVAKMKCSEYNKMKLRKKRFVAGGKDVYPGEIPHAVALGYGTKEEILWGCSGSLISDQWVLTASHCSPHPTRGQVSFANLGIIDLRSKDGEILSIIQIFRHPLYSRKSFYNDISLMKLERPVIFSIYLRPVCMDYEPHSYSTGSAKVSGWGLTKWSNKDPSDILQVVTLRFYNKTTCDGVFEDEPRLAEGFNSSSQICLGFLEGGKDTCRGDSGGGVYRENLEFLEMMNIIGITSAGSKFCATENVIGIYTRVNYFLQWIERIVWPEYF